MMRAPVRGHGNYCLSRLHPQRLFKLSVLDMVTHHFAQSYLGACPRIGHLPLTLTRIAPPSLTKTDPPGLQIVST
ncbi:MAG: hypothetical protein ABW185_24505 [Sedimenticola sp.]